ncbi:MAG: hypothetical protein GC162_10565 [Planctomycetes bacterium]|nr:hypothetical protein [Planctomycetota bacterium]
MSFTAPMFGKMTVRIAAVREVSIHGDVYFDLRIETESGEGMVRVAEHVCGVRPGEGQVVEMSFLMGQVQGVVVKER